ncbi:hypothetical protein HK100_002054 [Physocladia obscura]|uniref:F-box domain-containing protein n=1 Tax=Physocladia obscura TaxID=109957 RepID=A0AAD5SXK0_9FUNG|nr:hypothetical protein HK100_002054 [Physocladia obscura]
MNTLQTLPPELLDSVVAFTPPEDILRLATVMRYFGLRLGHVRRTCILAGDTFRLPISRIWPHFKPTGTGHYKSIEPITKPKHAAVASALVQCLDAFGGLLVLNTAEPQIVRDWKNKNLLTKRIILLFLA